MKRIPGMTENILDPIKYIMKSFHEKNVTECFQENIFFSQAAFLPT